MEKEIAWLLKDKYSGVETPGFKKDIQRLNGGEPLDYVIGSSMFLGCRIDLSKKPLIPRPETEFWVAEAIKQMSRDFHGRENRSTEILDIFSGSGCIGISIMAQLSGSTPPSEARHVGSMTMTFAEKDKKAIQQIKMNVGLNQNQSANSRELADGRNGYSKVLKNFGIRKYKIIQSDMFDKVVGRFDYIFANPPYIPTVKKSKIQKSVLDYEPSAALFGGKDGLLYIRKFLAQAQDFLNPGGKMYMEFDITQKKAIGALLKKYGYKSWEFHKDQYNRWRWITIDGRM